MIRLRVKAIRRLHEHRPPRTRMICFDEWGSLELKPHGGTAWAAQRRPRRMRATYRGLHGARHFLGFYDVHGHVLGGVFRPRKRISDLLAAFGRLRRCYPTRRLVVVLDKLHDIHDHPRFLRGLRRRRITPVFTATNASWMNLIEAQYGALKRFALTDTDDTRHAEHQRRIYRFLRYQQQRRTVGHPLTRLHRVRSFKLEAH